MLRRGWTLAGSSSAGCLQYLAAVGLTSTYASYISLCFLMHRYSIACAEKITEVELCGRLRSVRCTSRALGLVTICTAQRSESDTRSSSATHAVVSGPRTRTHSRYPAVSFWRTVQRYASLEHCSVRRSVLCIHTRSCLARPPAAVFPRTVIGRSRSKAAPSLQTRRLYGSLRRCVQMFQSNSTRF